MRQFLVAIVLLASLTLASAADSAGKVIKVLPLLLDLKGHEALSPSLFDRDAYQAQLREHTNQISTIRFDVQWAAPKSPDAKFTLRAELRGVTADGLPHVQTLEAEVTPLHHHNWTSLPLTKSDYEKLGSLAAWRVTLWQDGQQIGEQKSFLW